MRREPFDKKGSCQPASSNRVCSIHFVDGLATDENPIPTLFRGYESKDKKSRTLFRKPLDKKVREGDITPVPWTSREEEVTLQANFLDQNLDINMEGLDEPIDVIHEPIKIISGDRTYYLLYNFTPCHACHGKSNLVKALV